MPKPKPKAPPRRPPPAYSSAMAILFILSLSHLLNDAIQALIPAIYPLIKTSYALTFTQIGLITLTYQMVGSVLQPIVGFYTDRHPKPYSLVIGMGITLCGLVLLALAPSYHAVIIAAGMVGLGSAIFHPESSRIARLASGGRHGFAQSLFQVGGNAGTSIGPLLAAWIIVPRGQRHILWFTLVPLVGMMLLGRVGNWYRDHLTERAGKNACPTHRHYVASRGRIIFCLVVLLTLMFSKFFYLASMTNYYTFYLIQKIRPVGHQLADVLVRFPRCRRFRHHHRRTRRRQKSDANRSSGFPFLGWRRLPWSCPSPIFFGPRCYP